MTTFFSLSRIARSPRRPPLRRRSPARPVHAPARGYSLLELMIGMILGLVSVGALYTVFVSSRANFRRDEQIAQVQENARFALDALTRDLQNGGYWGGMPHSADIQANLTFVQNTQALVPVAKDCGPSGVATTWLFDLTRAFYFRNHTGDTASPADSFQCLSDVVASIAPNTDIVGIKRVATQVAATGTAGTLTFPRVALSLVTSSDTGTSTVGMLLQPTAANTPVVVSTLSCTNAAGTTAACQPQGGTVAGYRLQPSVYYVRTYTRTASETPRVPALCRRVLAIPVVATKPYSDISTDECIATGVENLQIEWGVGTIATPNVVDHYTSTPLATDFTGGLVNTARVFLLMRSAEPQVSTGARGGSTDDTRTYTMADYSSSYDSRSPVGTATGSDSYYRKLYTVTVYLKNCCAIQGS